MLLKLLVFMRCSDFASVFFITKCTTAQLGDFCVLIAYVTQCVISFQDFGEAIQYLQLVVDQRRNVSKHCMQERRLGNHFVISKKFSITFRAAADMCWFK